MPPALDRSSRCRCHVAVSRAAIPALLALLLATLTYMPTAAAAAPERAYACLFAGDNTCGVTATTQCLEFPLDTCTLTAFGTHVRVTRLGAALAPNTTYSLDSFSDAACTASLGPAYDTGVRAEAECFFLGTVAEPLGYVAFLEPPHCSGRCGQPPSLAYTCLHSADADCNLTPSTPCLPFPLDTCTPTDFGTFVSVSRSGAPYANGTVYELESFVDVACTASLGPEFDTGRRAESECFFLGTQAAPLGFVTFREPPTCAGRCIAPEPKAAFACLFAADSTCQLSDTSVCLEFALGECVQTDFGTYVTVTRNGSSFDGDTTYALDSFFDDACTVSLGAGFDTGPRTRGECFFLGTAQAPLGYVAFHEPATCQGYCDATEEPDACNPTSCSTGMQCVDNPGVCGPLNDW